MNLFVVILVMILVCVIILEIKVDNAYRNCCILLEAVHLYNIDVINSEENPLNNKPIIARQTKIPILETKFKMSLLLLIIFIILN